MFSGQISEFLFLLAHYRVKYCIDVFDFFARSNLNLCQTKTLQVAIDIMSDKCDWTHFLISRSSKKKSDEYFLNFLQVNP